LLIAMMRVRPEGLVPEGVTLRRVIGIARHRGLPGAPTSSRVRGSVVTVNGRTGSLGLGSMDAAAEQTWAVKLELSVTAQLPQVPRGMLHDALAIHSDAFRPGESVVVVQGLFKSFGGIHAVRGLDIELAKGKITSLLGPNGAGKTTVFNLITGRIRPDRGTVLLRGKRITGMSPHRVAALGMVRSFQDVRTYVRLTLLDNVVLSVPGQSGEHLPSLFLRPWATIRDDRIAHERAMECLAFVGLEDRAHDMAGALGFGDQKLLGLARLLATGGDILLLDEPAAGIDRSNLEPVLEAIERLRKEGKTICLVEHNRDVVTRLADHVLFMENGSVVAQGTMSDIVKQPRLAEVYFGHV